MSSRADLLNRADELAQAATRGSRERSFNSKEALVEELEALRLTLLALFGPMAEATDLGIALLGRCPDATEADTT